MVKVLLPIGTLVLGAALEWLRQRSERRSANRHELMTRWDVERLRTYSDFGRTVRASAQRARTLANNGIHKPDLDEYVRDQLREEILALERIRLLATNEVRGVAQLVHDRLRGWMALAAPEEGYVEIDQDLDAFYRACRDELFVH